MKKIAALGFLMLGCASVATPQGRPVDWPSLGGDARRSGWEKSDTRITKDNVKDFQLVLKRKLEGPKAGPRALTPPVVIGLLISYKGFKELGFVAGNSGDLWAIDVDTDRMFWHKRFDTAKPGSAACADMATAPALTPPAVFGRRTGPRPAPGAAPAPRAALPARLGGGGFGGSRPIYVVTGDGKLHQVNTSDGSDLFPPLDFLPANAKPESLLMTDNTIYAMTTGGCGGVQNAIWAIDLALETPTVASFPLTAANNAGFAVGNDGTVYVQSDTLLALSSKELKSKGQFSAPDSASAPKPANGLNITTPVVFEFKGVDLIVSAGKDGRLYLLDSRNIGGDDHKTPVSQTPPIASPGGGIFGGLSTWEDSDGVRWVAAPVWGPVNAKMTGLAPNGDAPNGSIVAFRVEEKDGKPALVPAWASRDMKSPVAPVITSGIVFGLSTKDRATLFALDGATGKEMYSTGNQVAAPGSLSGLTVANGRVFFTTTDNTLYGFGIFLER